MDAIVVKRKNKNTNKINFIMVDDYCVDCNKNILLTHGRHWLSMFILYITDINTN